MPWCRRVLHCIGMLTLADGTLTGVWLGDARAVYYIRHHLGRIWWVGLSVDSPLGAHEFHPGVRFANVFCGRLMGDTIVGEWADTPRGDMPQNGVMDLEASSGDELRLIRQVGNFGCSAWRRVTQPVRVDNTARFNGFHAANPKQTGTCAETSVVQGVVVAEPTLLEDDINLSVRPDAALCRLPESSRWPAHQPLDCRISGLTDSGLIPGWRQRDGNSVLFRNGRPINGDVVVAPDASVRILGHRIVPGTEVRLTGCLSAWPDQYENSARSDARYQTPVLTPVFSLDIVEPVARGTLTGTWTADDHGTYYLRQVGATLWWLGLSHDQGRTFCNVFSGAIAQSGADITVTGDLVDVPLGARLDALQLTLSSSDSTMLATTTGPPRRWTKLSDTIGR